MKLIKFQRKDCTPCLMVDMFFEDKEVKPEIIDVEEQPNRAAEYGIMSVPVCVLVDDDENEVARSAGFNPAQLESLIAKLNS